MFEILIFSVGNYSAFDLAKEAWNSKYYWNAWNSSALENKKACYFYSTEINEISCNQTCLAPFYEYTFTLYKKPVIITEI